jgi:AraC-like DNA-binding protein
MKESSILLRLVHESLLKLNLDANAIYRKCGVTLEHVKDTSTRHSYSANNVFWQSAEEMTGNKNIGLHVAEAMPLYRGQVLEYLFLSSPNFGEGLKRALHYQRLLTDVSSAYLEVAESNAILVLDTKLGDQLIRHYNECVVLGLIRFFESLTDNNFNVSAIDFIYPEPEDISEYKRIYDCELRFSQKVNAIHFNADVLAHHSIHAEPELLRLHEKVAGEHVARIEQEDMVLDVRRAIGELLESQEVSLEMVSASMNMTTRNLRSALSLAGTSFNQVLSDYRSLLAKRLLVQTNESIEEIVYLTGFSEPSTFYRAFKRWTDTTPIEYRKAKKGSREIL